MITRPENRVLFTSCGFYPLAETQSVLMLENKKNGLDSYYKKFEADGARLKSGAMNDGVGCIVMNCNPFTKGHQELITYAASKCSLLHIFVVEENRSMFPFADRFRLVREGTDHIPNVLVHPSGPYMISNATFPTYFLKKGEDAVRDPERAGHHAFRFQDRSPSAYYETLCRGRALRPGYQKL